MKLFFTDTEESSRPKNNYRVIIFLSIVLFLFMNVFKVTKRIHRVHIPI